jgi:hypothetical protein
MNIKILTTLIIVAFCALTSFAETKNEIVLNDGRVLKNPYIISRTPAGLNVGHQDGVIFVPFRKMSKERQKQYGYSPKESKKYKKKIAKAQRSRQVRIAQEKKVEKVESSSFSYGPERFPVQATSSLLQNELAELLREKARLEKEHRRVQSGRVNPASGPSNDAYISYRGGKVYRKKRTSYGKQSIKNLNYKKKRLKEINGALQRNIRRTTTVRDLIKRETNKGIKKGRTLNY